jgi:N-acetylglucosamine-6-phosphate deacetylase
MLTHFYNGRIIQGHKIIDELWVKDGFVINPSKEIPNVAFDLNGQYLAPGFIDLQINGGFGVDFTSNLEDVSLVAKNLLSKGVVAFLPTIISSEPDVYQKTKSFHPKEGGKDGASILGLHLEGPFLNPLQSGAHNKDNLSASEGKNLEEVYGSLDSVKMVTLAPEMSGALDMIKQLKQQNIVIACGHSQASSAVLKMAIEHGLTVITHLYNAMPSFHHRISSIIETVFSTPDLYYSMIVDGIHVSDTAIKMAWKMNPKGLFFN